MSGIHLELTWNMMGQCRVNVGLITKHSQNEPTTYTRMFLSTETPRQTHRPLNRAGGVENTTQVLGLRSVCTVGPTLKWSSKELPTVEQVCRTIIDQTEL